MSLLERAERVLPGGVSSPVRAFRGVGGEPVFVRAASGAYLEAEDGRRYIDYIGGYGPHILGHRHPTIVAAIEEALGRGTTFGAPTLAEVELAEIIAAALPAVDMVRLVNSGTEATMSALRLARAATGRNRFVKFEGCYHGHADPFLIAAGSGAATIGVPSSPGVPEAVVADTLLAPYNDLAAVERLFDEHGDAIAAVVVEPVAGNMNLVPPEPGFLAGLRALCDRRRALLIFDEVMTGFRVAWGGAQNLFDIRPDLTTLGKVIGGGLPLAAYAGPRELMRQIAPAGPVYQAGTLSGNPLAVAAGRAALHELGKDDPCHYESLERSGVRLQEGIEEAGRRHGVPCRVQRQGSMLGLFFTSGPVRRLEDVHATDRPRFSRVFHRLLGRGVHLPPSPYEAMFLSTAHGEAEIAATLEAFDEAFAQEAGETR
ncbi:MAG TPA: glutamate-1-semialdehyde 2,1-aminomutase [Thermoanaerobaculia bacterium]|jgi:glutamate-1-semialdehyde 2,1-aminomutase|nr:glutamate-1-semialdehyde 2,1-aminomutase [Thermoanaerobaculia bacterium]